MWLPPLCCTRTGASHLRKGSPCQDASGLHTFHDLKGATITLMAVADGHGGARYVHSDVGSWLACRVALITAQQQLREKNTSSGSLQEWNQWLGQELPRIIHRRWLRAVEKHWHAHHAAAKDEEFVPLLYGATLGLVIMTPGWWGQTGLGDWDLLQVKADGAELLSEESDSAASGEATFSLCLKDAPAYFASRTSIQTLDGSSPGFALMLSTDGIRKSCSTDQDFFAIARYLSQTQHEVASDPEVDFDESLDRISSQGSGDDVSVAVGFWHPERPSTRKTFSSGLLGSAGSKLHLHPSRPQSLDKRLQKQLKSISLDCLPQSTSPDSVVTVGSVVTQRRKPGIALLSFILLAGLIGPAALFLIARSFGLSRGSIGTDRTDDARSVPAQDPVQLKIHELCKSDVPIYSVLKQRRIIFAEFIHGTPKQNQHHMDRLMKNRKTDPLGALIGFSYKPSSQARTLLVPSFVYPLCPKLQQAFTQMWLDSQSSSASNNSQLINFESDQQDIDSPISPTSRSSSVGHGPGHFTGTPFEEEDVPSTTTIPIPPVTEHR
jgi:hypothetical protein